MPLLPPRVVGPLSECSKRVRIQGQLTGSTVVIFAKGDVVAKGEATGPDQWFDLDEGVTLSAGAEVTAFQDFRGEASMASIDAIMVQARPRHPGHLSYVSHLWIGGQCFLLAGAVPGAEVTVTSDGGTFKGTADGTAIINRKPLVPNEIMKAHQTACGVDGPSTPSVAPDEVYFGGWHPRFQEPLSACQTQITVIGAVEGSSVTITRSSGQTLSACFPLSSGPVDLSPALEELEELTVLTQLPALNRDIGESSVHVGSRPPEPSILGKLCAGTTNLRVKGTTWGQRISVLQDGENLGTTEAPAGNNLEPSFVSLVAYESAVDTNRERAIWNR